MATINLGNIKFTWQGAYNAGTAYAIDDVVSYNGSSYVCIQASTGNLPTVTTHWNVMSTAGTNGTNGTDLTTTLTTQGDIVYRDGSGLQRLGAGTSGQFLKTQGTGANPVWANLASNVDVVSYVALDATGVNTIDTTTNWATNNYYKMEVFMQYQMDANQGGKFRFRSSGGAVSNDTYQYLAESKYATQNHSNAVFGNPYDLNGSRTEVEMNGWGFNSGMANPHWNATIYKPDPNNRQFIDYHYFNSDQTSPSPYHAYYNWHVWNNDTTTKTGWQVYGNSSAKFKSGFYVILGFKYQ